MAEWRMSEAAIRKTTEALRDRLAEALGAPVRIGPPQRSEAGEALASILLLHVEVNSHVRGEIGLQPADPIARAADTLALDLHFLITALRRNDDGPPDELDTLGRIAAELQRNPTLNVPSMGGQTVRMIAEPVSMEDSSRMWELFPHDGSRVSMFYRATPVVIEPHER